MNPAELQDSMDSTLQQLHQLSACDNMVELKVLFIQCMVVLTCKITGIISHKVYNFRVLDMLYSIGGTFGAYYLPKCHYYMKCSTCVCSLQFVNKRRISSLFCSHLKFTSITAQVKIVSLVLQDPAINCLQIGC